MKKFSWILALIAALAMVFIGCPTGGGGNNDNRDWADAPLTITDPEEIGKLLVSTHLFNQKTGEDAENDDGVNVVKTDKNVAIFDFPDDSGVDNLGFRIEFPQKAIDERFSAMEVTFKLTELTTITTGEFVKIGFKEKAYYEKNGELINSGKTDMTPYPDYELWFGTPAGGSVANGEGSEQTIKVPLYNPNKAPLNAIWFTHNKYKGDTGPFSGKKGSDGPIKYKLTITKIYFPNALVKRDLKVTDFEVRNANQYLEDNKGNATPIVAPTVTPVDGINVGTVTLAYEGIDPVVAKATAVPQTVGTFKILLSATGSDVFNAATDLNIGTLTVGLKAPAEKFKLSTNTEFQAKETGATGNDVLVNGLVAAGSPDFEVIVVDGKKALKLTTSAGWQGLDLSDQFFDFTVGAQVTVIAKVVTITPTDPPGSSEILLQGKPGAWGPIGANPGVTEGETVTLDRILTAGDVANIKGSSPAAIRIQLNNVAGAVFEIHEIVIVEGDPLIGTVSIAADPADAPLKEGVTLKATYTGDETGFTYQWKKDGVDIDEANSATLETDSAGTYTVVVSKTGFASATSNALIVLPSQLASEVILTEFNDIKFTGWGDLGSVGGNVTFTMKRNQYGCNTTYEIPDLYTAYDKVEISYTVTRLDGEAGVLPMKLTIKDEKKDAWSAVDSVYKDFTDSGDQTFVADVAWATTGSITFGHNDGGVVADDGNYTLKITKIRFYLE